jgi:aspartate/methionine/tyrosine aminotransferase
MKRTLKISADFAFNKLSAIRGLKPYKSTASFFMMVGVNNEEFRDISSETDFCQKLFLEQNCFMFPSSVFSAKGFFRIIICTNTEVL